MTADSISVIGHSHILSGKECQDYSLSWKGGGYAAAIVCDGHGSEKYIRSAKGSELACRVGKAAIEEFMRRVYRKKLFSNGYRSEINRRSCERLLTQLERSIIQGWNEAANAELEAAPLDADERFATLKDSDRASLIKNPVKAYGTTFIAAVMTAGFLFILKLGDSNASIVEADGIFSPEELFDEQLQFNITTSLCTEDADMMFRHYFRELYFNSATKGIVLTTDGVINCYRTEEAFNSFIKNVSAAYREEDREAANSELKEALSIMSEKGSGDDLSVAIIQNPKLF